MPSPNDIRLLRQDAKQNATYLVGFHTKNPRLGKRNNEFYLRCTIPHEAPRLPRDGKIQSLVIMVNGLAEADVAAYDETATELAENGLATIVLPLPNHFCRLSEGYPGQTPYNQNPNGDPFDVQHTGKERTEVLGGVSKALLTRQATAPGLWISDYDQMIGDITALLEHIKVSNRLQGSPLSGFFSENTRISLYGYSLGGLIALCTVVARPHLIRSCFVVNSGSSLEEISARGLYKEEMWNRIQLDILNTYQDQIKKGERVAFSEEFELIMLGNSPKLRQEKLRRLCRRILFIVGASDEVFDVSEIMRLGSRGTGITLLQLPAIGHFISSPTRHKPEWDQWRRFLGSLIASFERYHAADDLLEDALETALSTLADHAPMEKLRTKLYLYDPGGFHLIPVATSANIVGTWEANLTLPPGKGLCGEVFAAVKAGGNGTGERGQVHLDDFSSVSEGHKGYSAEEVSQLKQHGVGVVCAAPVFARESGRGDPATCVGVVGFASSQPGERSVLSSKIGGDTVLATALTLGEIINGRGSAKEVLMLTGGEARR